MAKKKICGNCSNCIRITIKYSLPNKDNVHRKTWQYRCNNSTYSYVSKNGWDGKPYCEVFDDLKDIKFKEGKPKELTIGVKERVKYVANITRCPVCNEWVDLGDNKKAKSCDNNRCKRIWYMMKSFRSNIKKYEDDYLYWRYNK